MTSAPPDDIEALRAALAAAEARAACLAAEASSAEAVIAALKLTIEKLRHALYGQRLERKARLIDQLELQLEELAANASADELAAEQAAAKTTTVQAFTRKRPSRQPLPAHLPREAHGDPGTRALPLLRFGLSLANWGKTSPRPWR